MKKIILTVMPDYGMGPFLWIDRSGDHSNGVGPNCCDSVARCKAHPLSAELHEAFAAWVTEFEHFPMIDVHVIDPSVDWDAFHARGLELARRLKAEVGDEYRVVYEKPYEDPGRVIDERREIHIDGTLTVLPVPAEPS